MTDQTADLSSDSCPDDVLSEVVARLDIDEAKALRDLEDLARHHPGDPRLPFLQGSVLAGARRYEEADAAMQRAVAIAPDYAVARFQLGFLRFTSGDAAGAEQVWAPLADRPDDDPFRLFAVGLSRLAVDDVAGAERVLLRGMAANAELPQLNHDMQMLLDEVASRVAGAAPEPAPLSGAQLLLMQDAAKPTRH